MTRVPTFAFLAIFVLFAGHAPYLYAQPTSEIQVRLLLGNFLKAFDRLDWPAFRECFVAQPVVFFPSTIQPNGKRVDDGPGFDEVWHRQFDSIRQDAATRGVTSAPFMDLKPTNLRIDFPAPTVAVVTFHLGPNNRVLSRRMFVVAQTEAGWKITHLHASNLPLTTK